MWRKSVAFAVAAPVAPAPEQRIRTDADMFEIALRQTTPADSQLLPLDNRQSNAGIQSIASQIRTGYIALRNGKKGQENKQRNQWLHGRELNDK